MRDRITIQETTVTSDSEGGVSNAWSTFKTRWSRWVPEAGLERFTEQREHATLKGRFEMRFLAGVTPKMRVSFDSRIFDILTVIPVDGSMHREMHLKVEEVL